MSAFERWLPHLADLKSFNVWSVLKSSCSLLIVDLHQCRRHFFLYGTAAGLIFGKLYFPNQDLLTGTLLAFGTYFIGFAARPIGAAIFGHYGDPIGRKATLIATLLCIGLATFAVAFVPTFASIGIWGAIILTILRAIQGIGVGGEWGGSVLLAVATW